MITRAFFILCLLLLTACNDTYTWRQKLTVTVQTPDGEVSASSITEVTMTHSDSFWMPIEARGVRSSIRGEAVTVEVSPGRYMFVLLDGQDQLVLRTFPQFTYNRTEEFKQWAQSIERHRGSGEVPPEYYPTMVTFENLEEPASVQQVDPSNLQSVFGADFSLRSLKLDITIEPKTSDNQIANIKWLDRYREAPILTTVDPMDFSLAARLRQGDFIRTAEVSD